MAASQASMAASRLLHLRTPALQALLRRHVLHPSTAGSPTQSFNLFHPENDSPDNSSIARNPNFKVSNLPPNFRLPLGYPVMRIEAARKASTPKEEEEEGDLEDDDDGFEDFDVDDDDVNMENFSGSDLDGEVSDEEDEDRRPRRK